MKKVLSVPGRLNDFNPNSIVLLFCLVVMLTIPAGAQKYYTAENSLVLKLGTTRPLRESINMSSTDNEKLEAWEKSKPNVVPNFAGRRNLNLHAANSLPLGPDPLFSARHFRDAENEILPGLNFEGLDESISGSQPPDVNGDVGRDFYLEIVNATFFRVFTKSGTPASGIISANSIWSQVQQSSAGDPIILFDQQANRWFLTEFPSSNRILIAISHDGDPRGSWDVYTFQTPRFPDFPKYAIWNESYFMTDNESGSSAPIYAINRQDLLSGLDTVRFQRLTVPKLGGASFEVGQPVDWEGMTPPPANSPGIVVKLNDDDWGSTDHDHIVVHKINIDWNNSANSNAEIITIATAPFDTDGCQTENTGGFSCIPQPNGQGIDGAEWIITNKAMYRNFGNHESIVLCFMVDVTGGDVAGIRWVEFQKKENEEWTLFQEGTVGSDDGLHRFMSSIGMDGQGNIGLAYSISGPSKFPSLRYTGRFASDPPGQMTFKEIEFATGGGSVGSSRYGDYASMSIDPSNDQTFWFAGEYVVPGGNWSTRIVTFGAGRDSIDIFPVSLVTPQNSPELGLNEPLTVCVLNRGIGTVDSFDLAYQFNGGAWIVEPALIDSLQPDSTYCHTFMTGLDFPAPGNYDLVLATSLDTDRNHRNDTLSFIVSRPAYKDIALEYIVPGTGSILCSDTSVSSIILRNLGADTITTARIIVFLENAIVDTVQWEGSIAPGQETSFEFNVAGIVQGVNHIRIILLDINGAIDEIPANNEIEWVVDASPGGALITINLMTDNFPEETTWELRDNTNQIIASDGPFGEERHLYSKTICVDPEECYTFIVRDAFGDGMSAQGVKGSYQILNEEGDIIASIIKANFGEAESNQFCISSQCLIELEVGVEQESMPGAGDAFVVGDVANGLGVLMYSINGGQNFQANGTFTNVAPGTYNMLVVDDAGCRDSVDFVVYACSLQTLVSTLPASGGDVGEIHVTQVGGIGPVLFSLNNGSFITDSVFTMLEPGNYVLMTKDSVGCTVVDSITISTMVGTVNANTENFIQITPNPGKDLFRIEALFNARPVFLKYTVFTAGGEAILNGTVVKYDTTYKGEIALHAYPEGMYYVVFFTGNGIEVKRIVKI